MSAAAAVVAQRLDRINKKFVEHFKIKNALSEKTAIEPDISSIASDLNISEKEIKSQLYRAKKFFKRVELTNKWYLDETSYIRSKKIEKLFLLILLLGVIIIIIYTTTSLHNLGVL